MSKSLIIPAHELRQLIRKTAVVINRKNETRDYVCRVKFCMEEKFLCAIATNGYIIGFSKTDKVSGDMPGPFVIDYTFADALLDILKDATECSISLAHDMVSIVVDGEKFQGKDFEKDDKFLKWEKVFLPIEKMEHIFSIDAKDLWKILASEKKIKKAKIADATNIIHSNQWVSRENIIGDVKCGGLDFIFLIEFLALICSPSSGVYKDGLLYFHSANEGDLHPKQVIENKKGKDAKDLNYTIPLGICHADDPNTFYILMNQLNHSTPEKILRHEKEMKKAEQKKLMDKQRIERLNESKG